MARRTRPKILRRIAFASGQIADRLLKRAAYARLNSFGNTPWKERAWLTYHITLRDIASFFLWLYWTLGPPTIGEAGLWLKKSRAAAKEEK